MFDSAKVRIEILPLKTGDGFFVRVISRLTGAIVDGPVFATDADATKWVEGRMGLRA
jgi:hypothetical protein